MIIMSNGKRSSMKSLLVPIDNDSTHTYFIEQYNQIELISETTLFETSMKVGIGI
jgi:hypothetical protein